MANLKYVCISDLHFGADNSILTNVDPSTGQPDPVKTPATLVALGSALNALTADLPCSQPPKFLLLGDILDAGVSPIGVTAMGFEPVFDLVDQGNV